MQIKFASYNIHKAVGLDRRRDPERIMAVLREIDADVIALQEVDRRFGARESVLPRALIDESPWVAAPIAQRPLSIGWHGNAILVKKALDVSEAAIVPLPTLEPRGAVRADVAAQGTRLRVAGLHLDLSGIRRRQQVRAVLEHIGQCDGDCPTVLMGDLNEWARQHGSLRAFGADWRVLSPGHSFPARHPIAGLDRLIVSRHWEVVEAGVHHSALAARASDHLPVFARLSLPKK